MKTGPESFFSSVRRMGAAVMDAVFPPLCEACDRPIIRHTAPTDDIPDGMTEAVIYRTVMAPFLCPECREAFTPVCPPICRVCGFMPGRRPLWEGLCDGCRTFPKVFSKARAFGAYELSLRDLIHRLKYQARLHLANPLGRLLFHSFLYYWNPADIDRILPMPLHIRKFRKRGFNQAYLLIRSWPRWITPLGFPLPAVTRDLLVRTRETAAQVGMDQSARMTNLRGAFAVTRPEDVWEKRILVVDDVYTTGATAEECAQTLLAAGARAVDILTLAQTLRNV